VRRQFPIDRLAAHQFNMLAREVLADFQRGIVELQRCARTRALVQLLDHAGQ
jgi:hypothetical protein